MRARVRRLAGVLRARLEALELLLGFTLIIAGTAALWSPPVAAVVAGLGLVLDALWPRERRS